MILGRFPHVNNSVYKNSPKWLISWCWVTYGWPRNPWVTCEGNPDLSPDLNEISCRVLPPSRLRDKPGEIRCHKAPTHQPLSKVIVDKDIDVNNLAFWPDISGQEESRSRRRWRLTIPIWTLIQSVAAVLVCPGLFGPRRVLFYCLAFISSANGS
jgi:hypothetical protein